MKNNLTQIVPRFESTDVVVEFKEVLHRIAKIQFAKDGSIYVFFPGFRWTTGLACKATLRGGATYPSSLDLTQNGKVTSHLVKYSHHSDGEAHFSQDGKVRTEIRRKAVNLDEQQGHLFTIQTQDIESFRVLDKPRNKQITIKVEHQAGALKFIGWRFPINRFDIPDNASNATQLLVKFPDGSVRQGICIAPPIGMKYDDRILFLSVEEIPWLSSEENPILLFIGGFDHHSRTYNRSVDTEMLALSYPCSDYSQLSGRIGSIDFVRQSSPVR